jgi:glycosyltransferase involved in cell wall biosynthesis
MKSNMPDMGDDLSVVIPAFNEAQGIIVTLAELKAAFPSAEIIVVDDGSTDETAANAKCSRGVIVLSHRFNRGYGAALKTGMRHATRPLVAWFDADNEHSVEDLLIMRKLLYAEKLAAVVGARDYSAPTVRRVGKVVIRVLARILGTRLGRDINCGLRIFRREVILPYLGLLPNAYSASLTSTMIMIERGYPFAFCPITPRSRIGESKVRLLHGFQSLYLVVRIIMLFGPLRIFFPIGTLFFVTGLAYGITMGIYYHMGMPVLSSVVILLGAMITLLGLVADQVSQLRLAQLGEELALQEVVGKD